MKVSIKYKKNENQGFFNEVEKDLGRVPEKGELVQLDGNVYFVNQIVTDIVGHNGKVSLELCPYEEEDHNECGCPCCAYEDDADYVCISCSIKDYKIEDVIQTVDCLMDTYDLTLINGFLLKDACKERGFDTSWANYIDASFAGTINFYDTVNQKVLRDEMVAYAKAKDATVFVIGDIEGDVEEEFKLYQKAGLQINVVPMSYESKIKLPF